MAQRDNSRLGVYQSAAGPTGRCPVKPSTPLGPDQVNVFIYLLQITPSRWVLLNQIHPGLGGFVDSKNASIIPSCCCITHTTNEAFLAP
jgi:hypothetical protein